MMRRPRLRPEPLNRSEKRELRQAAACNGHDPDIWFQLNEAVILRAARFVCGACSVRQMCLQHALATDEEFGVWGGATPDVRRLMVQGKRPLSQHWKELDDISSTCIHPYCREEPVEGPGIGYCAEHHPEAVVDYSRYIRALEDALIERERNRKAIRKRLADGEAS